MAKFNMELPQEIMRDFEKIHGATDEIFGKMVEAGAEVVLNNVKANVPDGIRSSEMMANLIKTKAYKTPSDDGINSKVLFAGYFIDKDGRRKPAPLVANVFEYGRSGAKFPKQPFFRKSFRKSDIEAAMLKAQKSASGGLLDE